MKKVILGSFFCFFSFPLFSNSSFTLFNSVIEARETQRRFAVSDLPGIFQLELPKAVKILLASAEIKKEEIVFSHDCVQIQTTAWSHGENLDVDVVLYPSNSEDVYSSVLISLPDRCKFSDLIPLLDRLDVFAFKNMNLIVSNFEHVDKRYDIEIKKGANLFGSLSLSGPIKYLNLFIGNTLEEVKVSGVIVPGVFGSSFSAKLPGKISFMGGFSAQDLSFFIVVEDPFSGGKNPLCSVDAQLNLKMPCQDELIFLSELDLYHKEAILYGAMDGVAKNLFGIYGMNAGNWFLGATVDYTSLIGQGDLIPFSEFVAGFDLEIAGKKVEMVTKVGLPGVHDFGNLMFEGKLESDFSFNECVDLVGSVIEENPLVPNTVKDFNICVDGCFPDFAIGDVHLFFSPKDVEINGTRYTKGLIVEGHARLFGSDAEIIIDIEESGMKILGYLEELDFGYLKITGPGYDRIMDTPDDGLILDAVLRLDEQRCFLSGAVEIDIFGGITAETEVDVTASGLVFHLEEELFNIFEFGLIFSAQMNDSFIPFDFYVEGHMRQSALTALQNILSKTAHKMALKKIEQYKQNKFDVIGTASDTYNGFWNIISGIVGNTFNIKEFLFESSLEELVNKTHLPSVTIKGVVLGKEFELNDITFDMSDPIASAKEIIEAVAHMF